MRLLTQLESAELAHRFCDYLLTLKVPAQTERGNDGRTQVWVERDDDIEPAQAELAAYLANPLDARYDAAQTASRVREQQRRAEQTRRANYTDVRTNWAGSGQRATPAILVMLGLCVLATMLTNFGAGERPATEWLRFCSFDSALGVKALRAVIEDPSLLGSLISQAMQGYDPLARDVTPFADIAGGQVWRLVTPAFMHGNVLHLLFNLSMSYWIGGMIERQKGSLFMVGFVLLTAISSNAAQAIWMDWWSNRPPLFLGFSGVGYALFGYAWIKGTLQPSERIAVEPQTVGAMLMWFALCFTGLMPVANAAHAAGLGTGMLLGSYGYVKRKLKNR